MAKNLVIVESPAKKKIIQGFLGKDFVVESSIGHIRDLPKKGGMAIDIKNGFEPNYVISEDKTKVVSHLKNIAKKSETVWLATDEDREGEAIAWHLTEALKLDASSTKRIVFHEITKNAITKAVENPRVLDTNLVNAQQARRVLDRLVGFELSPVLWRKVKQGLSAGRVQSVAVRLIVERENEISNFTSISSYKVVAFFINSDGNIVRSELPQRFKANENAYAFMEKCKDATFSVGSLERKPAKKSATAPFTTSTLQQEASRKLGFSVSQTMMVAQKLYEAGKITYMRTDSVNLSQDALAAAELEITNLYGEEFAQRRVYTKKAKGAQEAHEAIRPSYMNNKTVEGDSSHQRLYDLIWKRTISSQMADAQFDRTTVKINISNTAEQFVAKGEVITFEGFMKVYLEGKDDDNEEQKGMLPKLEVGEALDLSEAVASEQFSRPPARYAEASLVKKMEELGIGRPSTYAATITTIQKRGYIEKESRDGFDRISQMIELKDGNLTKSEKTSITGAENKKLFPTDVGIVVTEFLVEHFSDVMEYSFTASVETEFDEIAEGKKVWNEMIASFYGGFKEKVLDVIGNVGKASGERELGNNPISGEKVFARIGPFGPMVQMGEKQEDENAPKPKFASLLKGQTIQTITLDEAMDLFKLPRMVGEWEGKEIVASVGRFGPYLRYDSKFTSIKKTDEEDPLTIELERSIELIKVKIQADKDRLIANFDGDPLIQILNGRYGPFIQVTPPKGKKINVKIPKGTEPKDLNREECVTLWENQPAKKAKGKKNND
ncbi:MAG: type I DNA topoisomerase [Flavobacteriales bacterium]|jgi:DNA topoisomerase I|nr:type I DNA topoisomerase [Flavobacteriales bacterium]MBT5750960.1 type I DNA topoisomerase [Flavobacteriales bacterium]